MALRPDILFGGLAPKGIAIVAVSGGGDSMALLLLAQAWAAKHRHDLHAVTIDHGLRPEAAAEAAFVDGVCARLGVDHTTIAWHGRKPETGLAQAARRARYALLEGHAEAIGADLILTAHTADDQAETVAMRISRHDGGGSLGRGLAGMARRTRLPGGTILARPLLGVDRERLRTYLREVGQAWIEDPTNQDESFERVRVRRAIAADPQQRRRLLRLAAVMGRWRAVLARDAAAILELAVSMLPGPVWEARIAHLEPAAEAVRILALQVLIAMAGGERHLAARASIAALPTKTDRWRATLGGALIECDGTRLRLWREQRNLERLRLAAGRRTIWDGRYEIENRSADSISVGPCSRDVLVRVAGSEFASLPSASRSALAAAPALEQHGVLHLWELDLRWDGGQPRGGGLARIRVRRVIPAIEHFCHEADEPLRQWLGGFSGETMRRPAPEPGGQRGE